MSIFSKKPAFKPISYAPPLQQPEPTARTSAPKTYSITAKCGNCGREQEVLIRIRKLAEKELDEIECEHCGNTTLYNPNTRKEDG